MSIYDHLMSDRAPAEPLCTDVRVHMLSGEVNEYIGAVGASPLDGVFVLQFIDTSAIYIPLSQIHYIESDPVRRAEPQPSAAPHAPGQYL